MGMKSDEFWRMSWREFSLKSLGHNERKLNLYRERWEQIRWQTLYLLNPHIKRPIRTAQRLIKFPWEKSEATYMTREQEDDMKRKFRRLMERN